MHASESYEEEDTCLLKQRLSERVVIRRPQHYYLLLFLPFFPSNLASLDA